MQEAYAWARDRHGDQRRADGSTVLEHVLGVAGNVLRFARPDAELLVAALLHDLLENTTTTESEIAQRFGPRVATLVGAVTHASDEDTRVAAERAQAAGEQALLLRLCDRLDGVCRSPGREPQSRRRFLAATREVYLPLAAARFPELAEALRQALGEAEAAL